MLLVLEHMDTRILTLDVLYIIVSHEPSNHELQDRYSLKRFIFMPSSGSGGMVFMLHSRVKVF